MGGMKRRIVSCVPFYKSGIDNKSFNLERLRRVNGMCRMDS
jgi:putative component of membrane protein insertase Oxa1/YidC/SpoIIIJ protein YidD